jgi:hypothetical protein
LDIEASIETAEEVLPCDGRGEFNELSFVQARAKPLEETVGNVCGSAREMLRVFDGVLLEIREEIAGLVIG